MKVLYVILILLALFIVLTLIRAIFFKAKPVKREVFEEESVNSKRVEEHLCDAPNSGLRYINKCYEFRAVSAPAEMRGVPHHMIDVADPEEDYSVARYDFKA